MSNFVGIPLDFSSNFLLISHVLINIHEYKKKIICFSENWGKMCHSSNLIPGLVL